ncbi:MAG: hypothetical protein V5A43_10670 [Haloarculaceae archaeon]
MSWIRSSEGAILGVLLVISFAAVGTAVAYEVSASYPEEAKVGSSVTLNATIESPFADDNGPQEWTVVGETDLDNANWQIRTENVGAENGLSVDQGDSISKTISAENGTTAVVVEVSGTIPDAAGTYSYANQANVTALTVHQEVEGSIQQSDSWAVLQYTDNSRAARQAIDAAIQAGAEDATEESENALDNAVEFYNGGNFDKAIQNAEDAESIAEQNTGGPSMLLVGGVLVLLLIVIGAVVYVYRSNQSSGHKLQ